MRRATPAPARASAGSLVAPHHHTLCGIIRRVPRPAGPSPTRRKSLSTAHAPVIAQAAGYVDYADEATGRLRPHAGANSMCQPPHVMPVRPSREGKRLHGDGQRPPRASISSMTDLLSCAGTGMALTRPLRLMIPNTTTLPAAPQPRLPFRAPPRGRFAQLQGAVEWLPQVLDLVTAGLQHTVEIALAPTHWPDCGIAATRTAPPARTAPGGDVRRPPAGGRITYACPTEAMAASTTSNDHRPARSALRLRRRGTTS